MKNALCLFSLVLATVAAADPAATVTSVAHNDETGLVTVEYTLANGPAIVTADILTNGVSVGRRLCRTMMGDVNRVVTNASGRIYWIPRPAEGGFSVGANTLTVSVKARRPDDPPAYMVVRLDLEKTRRYYESADDLPHGIDADDYRGDSLLLRRIPAAGETFTMGARRDEPNASLTKEIGHRVSFTNDYFIGVFEFTYRQAQRFDANVYRNQVNSYPKAPLTNVGYEGMLRGWRGNGFRWPQNGHAVTTGSTCLFGPLRSRTGLLFDLPTEAQWEFAARAGSTTSLPFEEAITNATTDATVCEFAWCKANADGAHHPVGLKRPNAWGLYDVLGNVSEECLDVWSDDITVYGEIDPPGFATEERTSHVLRGGNYTSKSGDARLGSRLEVMFANSSNNYTGFRIWCPILDESTAQ